MREALQTIFEKYRREYSGSCLVKTGEEALLSSAAGYANRAWEIPNQIDTMLDTASVTKVYTAIAVLLLVERGMLRLSDRITDIVDLRGTKIPADVEIEHLLTHTSGIADDADEEAGEDYSQLFVDKPNYSIRQCRDFLPQFAHKEPLFSAGTNIRYNNCAFVLLGLAIEAATGKSYRDFVQAEVFDAAGLKNTRFCAMDGINPNAAEGYIFDGEMWRKNIYSYPPIGTADGGAYTTVGDLDALLRAVLGGKLLKSTYADMLLTPHSRHARPSGFGTWRTGYAFEFLIRDGGDIFCMYKEGGNAGVDAIFAYFPQHDLSVNLLANQNGCLNDIYREMRQYLFDRKC